MIRLPLRQGLEQGASLEAGAQAVKEALTKAGLQHEVRSTEIVGPVIGQDLKRKGILATLTALGGILAYIALRFRPSFGVGAIVATFHDILVTLVDADVVRLRAVAERHRRDPDASPATP